MEFILSKLNKLSIFSRLIVESLFLFEIPTEELFISKLMSLSYEFNSRFFNEI